MHQQISEGNTHEQLLKSWSKTIGLEPLFGPSYVQ